LTFSFDFYSPAATAVATARDILKKVQNHISPDVLELGTVKISVQRNPEVKRNPGYITLGKYTPDHVFFNITKHGDPAKPFVSKNGAVYHVNMTSYRYKLFRRTPACVCCGIKGEYFLLQIGNNYKSPHFNFYGVNDYGKVVMLTCEPMKSKPNHYQTVCASCNKTKSRTISDNK
jgi:hypothetical protein